MKICINVTSKSYSFPDKYCDYTTPYDSNRAELVIRTIQGFNTLQRLEYNVTNEK